MLHEIVAPTDCTIVEIRPEPGDSVPAKATIAIVEMIGACLPLIRSGNTRMLAVLCPMRIKIAPSCWKVNILTDIW